MPIYRAERQFEASVMKFDDVVARDKRMIDYLKGRIRQKIRYVWQPGGDIFFYSKRNLPQSLMESGHDGYSFYPMTGAEEENLKMMLGIFD